MLTTHYTHTHSFTLHTHSFTPTLRTLITMLGSTSGVGVHSGPSPPLSLLPSGPVQSPPTSSLAAVATGGQGQFPTLGRAHVYAAQRTLSAAAQLNPQNPSSALLVELICVSNNLLALSKSYAVLACTPIERALADKKLMRLVNKGDAGNIEDDVDISSLNPQSHSSSLSSLSPSTAASSWFQDTLLLFDYDIPSALLRLTMHPHNIQQRLRQLQQHAAAVAGGVAVPYEETAPTDPAAPYCTKRPTYPGLPEGIYNSTTNLSWLQFPPPPVPSSSISDRTTQSASLTHAAAYAYHVRSFLKQLDDGTLPNLTRHALTILQNLSYPGSPVSGLVESRSLAKPARAPPPQAKEALSSASSLLIGGVRGSLLNNPLLLPYLLDFSDGSGVSLILPLFDDVHAKGVHGNDEEEEAYEQAWNQLMKERQEFLDVEDGIGHVHAGLTALSSSTSVHASTSALSVNEEKQMNHVTPMDVDATDKLDQAGQHNTSAVPGTRSAAPPSSVPSAPSAHPSTSMIDTQSECVDENEAMLAQLTGVRRSIDLLHYVESPRANRLLALHTLFNLAPDVAWLHPHTPMTVDEGIAALNGTQPYTAPASGDVLKLTDSQVTDKFHPRAPHLWRELARDMHEVYKHFVRECIRLAHIAAQRGSNLHTDTTTTTDASGNDSAAHQASQASLSAALTFSSTRLVLPASPPQLQLDCILAGYHTTLHMLTASNNTLTVLETLLPQCVPPPAAAPDLPSSSDDVHQSPPSEPTDFFNALVDLATMSTHLPALKLTASNPPTQPSTRQTSSSDPPQSAAPVAVDESSGSGAGVASTKLAWFTRLQWASLELLAQLFLCHSPVLGASVLRVVPELPRRVTRLLLAECEVATLIATARSASSLQTVPADPLSLFCASLPGASRGFHLNPPRMPHTPAATLAALAVSRILGLDRSKRTLAAALAAIFHHIHEYDRRQAVSAASASGSSDSSTPAAQPTPLLTAILTPLLSDIFNACAADAEVTLLLCKYLQTKAS